MIMMIAAAADDDHRAPRPARSNAPTSIAEARGWEGTWGGITDSIGRFRRRGGGRTIVTHSHTDTPEKSLVSREQTHTRTLQRTLPPQDARSDRIFSIGRVLSRQPRTPTHPHTLRQQRGHTCQTASWSHMTWPDSMRTQQAQPARPHNMLTPCDTHARTHAHIHTHVDTSLSPSQRTSSS